MFVNAHFSRTRSSLALGAAIAALLGGCGGGHSGSGGNGNGGGSTGGGGGTGDNPGAGGGVPVIDTREPRNAAACTDFYAYATAEWNVATAVPPDGHGIDIATGLAERNHAALLTRLGALSASPQGVADAGQRALLTLAASRADRAAVERAATAPLADELALIDRMGDMSRLPATWGALMRQGVRLPVVLSVQAFDDPETAALALKADRLRVEVDYAAPARPADEAQPGHTRAEFVAHVARTLELSGVPAADATREAVAVATIEQALAALPVTGDPAGSDDGAGPVFATQALLHAAGVPDALPRSVNDDALRALAALQAGFDAADWRAFTRWRLVRSHTDELPARFAAERATWDGAPSTPIREDGLVIDPRVEFLSRAMPGAFDRFFAQQVLPAGAAEQVRAIGDEVRAALRRQVDSRPWLNATSRETSRRMVDTVELLVLGLRNDGEDTAVSRLAVPAMQADALLANMRRAAAYDLDRRFAMALASRTGRASRGDAWTQMEARYDHATHSVVVGAMTVQALLAGNDGMAARYGTVGSVLAHEMLHMFAAPTDAALDPGVSTAWLDAADRPFFDRMVARLEQDYALWARTKFAAPVVQPRFMGEDLSDLGSIPVALSALHSAEQAVPGVTVGHADDAFYRAYAFAQRTRQSEADDRAHLATVPAHALYSYRANGPLANLAAFGMRYGCQAGDPMVRSAETLVDLW